MKWAAAISRNTSIEVAIQECSESVRRDLGPGEVSLAVLFVTPHFAAYYPRICGLISDLLGPETIIGCSGGGVIGGGEEVEHSPALSLVAARLPAVGVKPFRVDGPLPDLDGPPDAWEALIGVSAGEEPQFILLADPFSVRAEALLSGLDYAFPASPKIGGLASGASSPGLNALFLDGELFDGGAVGVALTGDIAVDTVVAQGCRPVGDLMRVTSCEENMLHELDHRPAFEVLQELFASFDERDRGLAQTSLFAGILMDELTEEPRVGDFLIRNLIGADPRRGAIAVGENLQEGMRLRFHLRDAETSAEDLHAMLTGYEKTISDNGSPTGALLFSCVGRGEYLYGRPNFDTGIFQDHLGGVPVGGFFCNGEIGPVAGTTFLHGYTSSFGLFRPRH
ncbi:MAG: FIST C-terminal domain-containing protein [Rubrobacter sp.]|jgi:small ligand-binding sensory domain FIST|nr:FIST C-terminal domain-containing protein [Rubrobacter sp.]MBA3790031.1 FIST C-terminal domain-containing protein [Rubrobacter sp.]